MVLDPNIENSLFGLATFGENIFTSQSSSKPNGIYYSKVFMKSSTDIWYQLNWADNQVINESPQSTVGRVKVEIRTRTGNGLPMNYATGIPYTLDQVNNIIQAQDKTVIEALFDRWTLNRSSMLETMTTEVYMPNEVVQLGTAINSLRLMGGSDPIWNYWSLPILNSPSFIPENRDFNYLQARITLESVDDVPIPEMYRINFSTTLKN